MNLDVEVVEALEALEGRSLSAVANRTLRDALAVEEHRAALARWLDELDRELGPPTPEKFVLADQVLEDALVLRRDAADVGAA